MESDIGLSLDKVKGFFKREVLGQSMVMRLLLNYVATAPVEVDALLASLSVAYLTQVLDVLSLYPFTDFGWSLLPAKDTIKHIKEGRSTDEQSDIETRQYADDRPHVEYLRTEIRRRLSGA